VGARGWFGARVLWIAEGGRAEGTKGEAATRAAAHVVGSRRSAWKGGAGSLSRWNLESLTHDCPNVSLESAGQSEVRV